MTQRARAITFPKPKQKKSLGVALAILKVHEEHLCTL